MLTNSSRRDFIKLLAVGAVLTACDPLKFFSKVSGKEFIYTGYRVGQAYSSEDAGFIVRNEEGSKRVKLANEIHSIQYSKNLDLKVFTSKLEKMSYYQFGKGDIKPLEAHQGHYFYGHAAIDEARNVIYFTMAREMKTRGEDERVSEPGFVYVYSLPDFKFLERFTSYGNDPHELKLFGDQLIVCNGGSDSNVAFIDVDSRKLIKSHHVRIDHISLRHIEKIDEENYIIAPLSRDENRSCPPYLLNTKDGFSPFLANYMFEMTTMRIQLLSIVVHEGHIYASCPNTDSVIVWKKDGTLVGGVQIPSASNIVVSPKLGGVIAGSGYEVEPARLITVVDGKIKFEKLKWGTQIMGSHATIIEG